MDDAPKLRTHRSYHGDLVVRIDAGCLGLPRPGDMVCHREVVGSVGVVVSREEGTEAVERLITVLWSRFDAQVVDFEFPRIRGLTSRLVAQKLLKVEPMSMPSGNVFYMEYAYGSGSMMATCNNPDPGDKVEL